MRLHGVPEVFTVVGKVQLSFVVLRFFSLDVESGSRCDHCQDSKEEFHSLPNQTIISSEKLCQKRFGGNGVVCFLYQYLGEINYHQLSQAA